MALYQSETDIRSVRGVGPAAAQRLAKLGIGTVGELLGHYPRRYIDYSHPYSVAGAPFDTECCVRAEVVRVEALRRISGGRTLAKALATDGESDIVLSWFNDPYTYKRLVPGGSYFFEGRVGGTLLQRQIVNPITRTEEQVEKTPLSPVYRAVAGLPSGRIARLVQTVLASVSLPEEPLPAALLEKYRLPGRWEALCGIHNPQTAGEAAAAKRRLIFEELFTLQLGILLLGGRGRGEAGTPFSVRDPGPFWASLPYRPTAAQRRAVDEVLADCAGPAPMNRLVQGDVGSGKTLVAAAAMWCAAASGTQSVLMAPTEILAQQHAETLSKMLAPFGVEVAFLAGGLRAAEKRRAKEAIADGRAQVVVATHAVLTGDVAFARLGLVVVDEQHRFGVRQRGLLAGKAEHPHVLVMSATPIPRTLALLVYGDLSISVLDELPPGRSPVRTWAVTGAKRASMYAWLRAQLDAGHQAYIVCPAIGEDAEEEDSGLQSVKRYYRETAVPGLAGHTVGLMHGKLKPREKEAVMRSFAAGETQALVSTTVIEVGVDVANASVMVIENAERFGLSTLHQLRGRVGRGSARSCCILVSDNENEAVRRRLDFLCRTADGFAVAQYDLESRGPGDFLGQAQHGMPMLSIADLAADTRAMEAAQKEARRLLAADPQLQAPEHRALAARVEALFARTGPLN